MSVTLRASWTRDTGILRLGCIDRHRCETHSTNRLTDVNVLGGRFRSGCEVAVKVQVFDGCCAPVTAGVLDESDAEDLAAAFKVLADPARLRLLSMVAAA